MDVLLLPVLCLGVWAAVKADWCIQECGVSHFRWGDNGLQLHNFRVSLNEWINTYINMYKQMGPSLLHLIDPRTGRQTVPSCDSAEWRPSCQIQFHAGGCLLYLLPMQLSGAASSAASVGMFEFSCAFVHSQLWPNWYRKNLHDGRREISWWGVYVGGGRLN